MNLLPPVTASAEAGRPIVIVCPWCREDMDQAQVRLGALVAGWEGTCPDWPERGQSGEAKSDLTVDCPSCSRPSMVALSGAALSDRDSRFVKLVPVRTQADARFVEGGL